MCFVTDLLFLYALLLIKFADDMVLVAQLKDKALLASSFLSGQKIKFMV